MRTVSLLALTALGAFATPALAQSEGPDTGPYVGMEAGLLIPEDVRVGQPTAGWVALDKGFDGGAYAGYDFGMFRLEAEFVAQHASVNTAQTAARNGLPGLAVGGDQRILAGMGNVLYDFGSRTSANFYVGGGVGYAWRRAEYWDASASPTFSGVQDNDGAFAWQLIAGVRYPLSSRADVGLKYRYFNAGRFRYEHDLAGLSTTAGGPTASWRR